MKFGWLHDSKNAQKWAWCREQRAMGRTVGVNWYSTDAHMKPRDDLERKLAGNFRAALDGALALLEDAGVVDSANHFVDPIAVSRAAWVGRAIEFLRDRGCDAVLLDPDTGVNKGKPGRVHATPLEIAAHAEAFAEVAVFQHTWQGVTVVEQHRVIADRLRPNLPAARSLDFQAAASQSFLILIS